MARENQGLQIALIVFVMLTVILTVTTYLYYRKYDEADKGRIAAQADARQIAQKAEQNEKNANDLRGLIGLAKTDNVEAMFKEDMNKFGGAYPEEFRKYRPLTEKLAKTLDERTADLAKAKSEIQKWTDQYRDREASKDPQMKDFEAAANKANKELASEQSKFKAERDRLTSEESKLHADLQEAQKELATQVSKNETAGKESRDKLQRLSDRYKQQSEKMERMTAQTFDTPNGEIRWVSQRSGVVWINLGWADSLERQVSFGVYPSDLTDMTAGGKKAGIEVTQILGDHLAEARVVEDMTNNPIMPGDKIYTPVWSPGEQRHFAVTGFVDLDGDNDNDIQTLLNVIAMNGGVVDCCLNDKGDIVGEMTVETRYLVCGDKPETKGFTTMVPGYNKMIENADRLGIRQIPLQELVEQMGWKNPSPVVHYGPDRNPKDFHIKPETGVLRSSTGTIFKPREPSRKPVPGSTYQKLPKGQ